MNAKNDAGMNLWDVIFSQDKHHFPIQRNYLQQPRGSNNPINRLVTEEVSQEIVDYVRKNITDPKELYALDFELNYTIRKLADFVLHVDLREFNSFDWEFGEPFPPLEDMMSILDRLYRWSNDVIFYEDLGGDIIELTGKRDEIDVSDWDRVRYESMVDVSRFQQAVQYFIENSDFDWKTKAEAFLRASSERGYSPADDETIIYLMSQSLNDEGLEKEAQHRWRRYKKEWCSSYFTDNNPFNGELSADRLRFIHWDKLSSLRPLEPLMLKAWVEKSKNPSKDISKHFFDTYDYRDTYNYKVESQHLLSPQFLSDYVKVFSLFRTDLDVDPIRSHLKKLIGKFYNFISGSRDFEYNYTVTDISYLSGLLFSFATNRFQHDILKNQVGCFFSNKARDDINITLNNSTVKFTQDIPLITLIALEVHTIYYSRPQGMVSFLHKAKEWLLNKQSPYGYWYDGVNNPEYTTVLVLDALQLIDGKGGLSFPIKTIPCYDKETLEIAFRPYMLVNYITRSLFCGGKEITFKFRGGVNKTWDFLKALVAARSLKTPLPRYTWDKAKDNDSDEEIPEIDKINRHDWKHQYDILSRKLGGNEILKQFINSTGDSYSFTEYVTITNHSSIRYRTDSKLLGKL